jgi:hypothetical protein
MNTTLLNAHPVEQNADDLRLADPDILLVAVFHAGRDEIALVRHDVFCADHDGLKLQDKLVVVGVARLLQPVCVQLLQQYRRFLDLPRLSPPEN